MVAPDSNIIYGVDNDFTFSAGSGSLTNTDGWAATQYRFDEILYEFFRINEKVKMTKESVDEKKYSEPLDELRLKIAKWLGAKPEKAESRIQFTVDTDLVTVGAQGG